MYTNAADIPVLGIIGYSGAGKTTLLEILVAELSRRGVRVGILKHDAHRFDIDRPGKDSWRLREAGATSTLLSSDQMLALQRRIPGHLPLEKLLNYFQDEDLILVEGHKSGPQPKIEIWRPEHAPEPLFPHQANVIALACPGAQCPPAETAGLQVLDLNSPHAILHWINVQGYPTDLPHPS